LVSNSYLKRGRKPDCASLPRVWLMTDERMGDALIPAIAALPRGSGVVFRHYRLPPTERRALFYAVQSLCRKHHHLLLLADSPQLAKRWRAVGAHGRTHGCFSAPAHNVRERIAAERRGANIVFLSPVFATMSHPGGRGIGRVGLGRMSHGSRAFVIALGGMNAKRARSLRGLNIVGWAAIDGLIPHGMR
jgi:thiamine-phosphate pyrophosphorylase